MLTRSILPNVTQHTVHITMAFAYLYRRQIIVLSSPKLKDHECPLRTMNSGCTIPSDMSYFEDSCRYQIVKLISAPSGNKTADQLNHQKLRAYFAHVLQNGGYIDPSEVVWSAAVFLDNKIAGTVVFTVAYLKASTGR